MINPDKLDKPNFTSAKEFTAILKKIKMLNKSNESIY